MGKYVSEKLKEQLCNKQDVLDLICGIADDYDGYRTVSGLMDVIDEIAEIAKYGIGLPN
jgi:hypothetical protein